MKLTDIRGSHGGERVDRGLRIVTTCGPPETLVPTYKTAWRPRRPRSIRLVKLPFVVMYFRL
jgi:hypothetical protein